MELKIEYHNINFKQLGVKIPSDDDFVFDEILKNSYLNAEIHANPEFQNIDISLLNYRDDEDMSYNVALVIYGKNPISYRKPLPMECELWNTFVFNYQKRFEAMTKLQWSGKLPKDLNVGQYRLDTLEDEMFFEFWIPLSPNLIYKELQQILFAIENDIKPFWNEIQKLNNSIFPPPIYEAKEKPQSLFLCHSSIDKSFVRKLREELRKYGVVVWFDEEQILVGHDFIDKMEEGIKNSIFTVVVLSENFVKFGPWAKEEYKSSLEKQVRMNQTIILPVLFSDCEIPTFLKTKKYADFRTSFQDGLETLIYSLNNHK